MYSNRGAQSAASSRTTNAALMIAGEDERATISKSRIRDVQTKRKIRVAVRVRDYMLSRVVRVVCSECGGGVSVECAAD